MERSKAQNARFIPQVLQHMIPHVLQNMEREKPYVHTVLHPSRAAEHDGENLEAHTLCSSIFRALQCPRTCNWPGGSEALCTGSLAFKRETCTEEYSDRVQSAMDFALPKDLKLARWIRGPQCL